MSTEFYIMLGAVGIVVIGLFIYFVYKYIKSRRFNTLKNSAKNKVSSICKKYSLINFLKYTQNFAFEHKGKKYGFDNIIATPFGLILINSCLYRGEIYCETNQKDWIHYMGDIKEEVENEQTIIQNSVIALREKFAKDKIYNIKLISVICFVNKKVEIFNNDKNANIFRINKLKSFLNNSDFLEKGNNDPKDLMQKVLKYKI